MYIWTVLNNLQKKAKKSKFVNCELCLDFGQMKYLNKNFEPLLEIS